MLPLLAKTLVVFVLLVFVCALTMNLVMRSLKSRLGLTSTGPARGIHLRRDDTAPLKDAAALDALVAPLLARGFEDGGTWVIEEMKLAVRIVARPDDAVYGVAYDRHPVAGVWLDLVTLYEDGSTITLNNLSRAGSLDERPQHTKVRIPLADALTLYRTIVEDRPKKPTRSVAAAEVPALFEKAYAEEMAWRDARGGPTEDEIRRIAAASGRKVTDEEVRRTREILAEQARSARGKS